jgi:hypothetical protein
MNFLEHTLDVLADYGKNVEDIEWIGTRDAYLTWDQYSEMAERLENLGDGDFNMMSIPPDLKIVGDNWWLELEIKPSIEEDNQIRWAYREKPPKPVVPSERFQHEINESIKDKTITDFKIIFGKDDYEHNEVAFREPNESYSYRDQG